MDIHLSAGGSFVKKLLEAKLPAGSHANVWFILKLIYELILNEVEKLLEFWEHFL